MTVGDARRPHAEDRPQDFRPARGSVRLPKAADRAQLEASAAQSMQKYVAGQPIKKVIIVPGRLINIVL